MPPPLLAAAPPADLVADPPFHIRRPGAYAEEGALRFVVHTPHAADLHLIGEWTNWTADPIQMRCTRDGTYWWGSVTIAGLLAGLSGPRTDYHGVKYQFMFNQIARLQDPAGDKDVDIALIPCSSDVVTLWLRQKGNFDFATLSVGFVFLAQIPIAIVERK